MKIDIDDGYTHNRYAKFKQQARNAFPQSVASPRSAHFRGNLIHDDVVEQETQKKGNKMGRNDDLVYEKAHPIFLSTRQKKPPEIYELFDINIEDNKIGTVFLKRIGSIIDVYV